MFIEMQTFTLAGLANAQRLTVQIEILVSNNIIVLTAIYFSFGQILKFESSAIFTLKQTSMQVAEFTEAIKIKSMKVLFAQA